MSRVLSNPATQDFLKAPGIAGFRALQVLAFQADDFEPSARSLIQIELGLRTNTPTKSLDELHALSAHYAICPRYHYVEARIRESLGELDTMQQSISLLKDCLRVLCETGDGSQESPFEVTFLTDMDDVVRSFGERVRYQQPVVAGEMQYDVLTAHSGIEFWFDVMNLVARKPSQDPSIVSTQNI